MNTTPRDPGPNPAEEPAAVPAFFDCSLTPGEVAITLIALAIAMALQCRPVIESSVSLPMIVAMACLCWLSPFTGFFYIASAQSLPYPEAFGYNPSQIGVATWIVVAVIRYRGLRLRHIEQLWPFVPFIVWFAILSGEQVWRPSSEYFKALIYAAIACQLANEAEGRNLKCLVGLCLGALTVTFGFWGSILGLPIELSEWGGSREGFARLGGARVDSIMVWPPCLMGSFGILGVAFSGISARIPRQTSGLGAVAGAVFLLTIPPLAATMSNAAYVGWGLMSVWLVMLILSLRARGVMAFRVARRVQGAILLIVVVVFIGYRMDTFSVRTRMEALLSYYDKQSAAMGVAASRTDVWRYSLRAILQSPLTGRSFSTMPEATPPGYMPGRYFSHSVFLDYARFVGIPGMLLLVFFFVFPFVALWRRRRFDRYMGFFLAYFAMFLFWMVLSFQFYKTFWGLWMLMAITARQDALRESSAAEGMS